MYFFVEEQSGILEIVADGMKSPIGNGCKLGYGIWI